MQASTLLLTLSCGLWVGCAAGSTNDGVGNGGSAGTTVASGFGTGASSGAGAGTSVLYAHTSKTLYQLDPNAPTAMPTMLGNFDCIGGSGQDSAMTDIAVSQQGDLWGITETSVVHLAITPGAIHCSAVVPLSASAGVKFYGLSFAPVGVLDPAKEVLVAGNTGGELWSIDASGAASLRGTLGKVPADDGNGHTYSTKHQGKTWELSGDIVFLQNGGAPIGFATVRDCPSPPSTTGCNGTDTLLELDLGKLATASGQSVAKSVRGEIVKRSGCADAGNASGYGSMFGIAAVGAKVFGFSHSGAIVEIANTDGSACLAVDTPSQLWDGAGVTTVVSVVAPPPK